MSSCCVWTTEAQLIRKARLLRHGVRVLQEGYNLLGKEAKGEGLYVLAVQKPCIIQHFVQHLAQYYFKLLTTLIISLNLVLLWQAHHKRHLPKWCLANDTYCLVLLLTGICILLMLYKKSSFNTPLQYHNEVNHNQWIWVLLWSLLQGWTTPSVHVSNPAAIFRYQKTLQCTQQEHLALLFVFEHRKYSYFFLPAPTLLPGSPGTVRRAFYSQLNLLQGIMNIFLKYRKR